MTIFHSRNLMIAAAMLGAAVTTNALAAGHARHGGLMALVATAADLAGR